MKTLILISIVSLATLFSTAQCVADFTWSVSGSTVQLTNTSSGTSTYNWSFGDGAYSIAVNPNHSYSNPGSYDICLSAYYQDSAGGFCSDSTCYQVTVFQDSTGGTGCSVNAFVYGQSGVIYGSNASAGADYYAWTVSDYNSGATLNTSSTTDLTYSPGYYGDFWICLTAFDSSGLVCDTLCEILTMQQDSLDSNLTVIQLNQLEFQLYPNPTNAVLNIQFDHLPSNAHAHIVDLLGREMIDVEVTTELTKVDVMDFPSGMYIVQLLDSNQQLIGMHRFLRE